MATVKAYADRGALIRSDYPNTTYPVPALMSSHGGYALTKFNIPSSVTGKEILDIEVYAYGYVEWEYVYGSWSDDAYFRCADILSEWDEKVVTYNTKPGLSNHIYMWGIKTSTTTGYQWARYHFASYKYKGILENGVCFSGNVYSFNSSYVPYLMIEYTDPTIYLSDASPQSGYVPKNLPTTFSWKVAGENYVYGGVEQTSATLEWREGSSGTIHSISIGSAQQYTVPGGTFTADEIQWRITVVASGQTKTSAWYTLSTVEATSTASLISPVSGFIDKTKDTVFMWAHIISTGTTQTAFDLQISTDGVSFSTLVSETTADESVTIQANTFDAGPLYWRVRTYNTDGNPGSWSPVAQVIVIGAPDTPVVTLVENSPRPLINWQGIGQQGYEVQVDGATVVKAFGVTKTYRAETYLADGQHTISVRVQNQYGLWSEWGTVSIQVANNAGSEITLTATGGSRAALNWTTDGAYDKYYVYRDGELIANTTATSYDDALTNDAHVYQVRGAYDSSGDYGLSNAVNVVVRPETTILATVDGAISVELPYSETNKRQTTMSTTRQMATMYFSGSPLPSMEIAEWTDRSMTITAALKAGESTKQLMNLVGKIVCARDQYGNCVIGPLPGWTVRSYEMYTALQTTIQDVNWREAIKHDPIA